MAISSATFPAMAYQAPEVKHEGEITYVTGGIGERETEALRSVKKDYALRVVNAGPKGAFSGTPHITISSFKGEELFDADVGPLFYANLPKGQYKVAATVGEETKSRTVTIKSGKPADVRFVWHNQ